MSDKCETTLPKTRSAAKAGKPEVLNKYRFQNYDDGKVHVHDDELGLVFICLDTRRFQLGIDSFIKKADHFAMGHITVIRTDVATVSSGRKLADVVLTKTQEGWNFALSEAGVAQADSFAADEVLTFLDDFVQRI